MGTNKLQKTYTIINTRTVCIFMYSVDYIDICHGKFDQYIDTLNFPKYTKFTRIQQTSEYELPDNRPNMRNDDKIMPVEVTLHTEGKIWKITYLYARTLKPLRSKKNKQENFKHMNEMLQYQRTSKELPLATTLAQHIERFCLARRICNVNERCNMNVRLSKRECISSVDAMLEAYVFRDTCAA